MNNKDYVAGQAAQCGTTARESEVQRALSDMETVIRRYENIVSRLSARLDCVVTPAPPACQGTEPGAAYSTELANRINYMRCTARDVTDCLESLLDRLEL